MKKFSIKKESGKILAEVYAYLDETSGSNKNHLLESILQKVPKITKIGFAGFKSKANLRYNLKWSVFDKKESMLKPYRNSLELKRLTKETILNCNRVLPTKSRLYIFIFPTAQYFVVKRMDGVNGYSWHEYSILLYVRPGVKGWKQAFKETLCHEYLHAVQPAYHKNKLRIIDWLVFDGLAEQFTKEVLKNTKSVVTKVLTRKQAASIFNKIKSKVKSYDEKLHMDLFYNGKKFPVWAGYSLGYQVVGDYLEKHKPINWKELITIPPSMMLKESKFV